MSVQYPPPGCVGRAKCRACERAGFVFYCVKCNRIRPWCYGAGDVSQCDKCWGERERALERKRKARKS